MDTENLYIDRKDLMTYEELEEYQHNRSLEAIPTFTPNMRAWLIDYFEELPIPDAEEKNDFLRREPAMGATEAMLREIRKHNARLPAVQQRVLFHHVRSKMLRQLISCSGAQRLDDLLDILEAESDSGKPSSIPKWYKFSPISFEPSRVGYEPCGARYCYRTESTKKQFLKCPRCKLVYYCCNQCRESDWKARHKQVCPRGGEWREQMEKISSVFVWGRS